MYILNKIVLFRERERVEWGEGQRETLKQIPAELKARGGTRSQDPESPPEQKSRGGRLTN